jgi:uncharacterized Tic20 family protein
VSEHQSETPTPQDGAPAGSSTPPPPPPPPPPPAAETYTPPPPPPAPGVGAPQGGYAPPQAAHAGQAPLSQSDERLWSMLGHLGAIILGFLAPLITWLVFRERSRLVDDQGKESLNFQITVLIAWVVASVLAVAFIGILLYPIIWIGNLVLCIIAGLAANRGEQYRYPFALRLIK